MKQYNTQQKKKIVEIISKTKNKKAQALKFNISIRTYYYWKKKLEEVIEIRKKYKYGKTKIKKLLEKENIKIGTTAIETILKEYHLYQKKKRKIRKKHKGKHVFYIKEAGEKVQIDVKYAFFGEIRYYQFTAVDLATRMTFRYLYDEKSPNSTIDFVKQMLGYFPFRVHSIQTDNGTEFTYRKHFFETEHPLDIFCKKNHIKRIEFYDFCTQELTLERANLKLRKYNNFWNHKRIHSALNYDTPMLYFKKLRNT